MRNYIVGREAIVVHRDSFGAEWVGARGRVIRLAQFRSAKFPAGLTAFMLETSSGQVLPCYWGELRAAGS